MSHVNDLAQAERTRLSTIYPAIPKKIVVGDEPAGDFGLAHYLGQDETGAAHLTFDVGYMPHIKTIAHELWHAAHEIGAGRITKYGARFLDGAAYVPSPSDPVLIGFHKAIGYTVPLEEIINTSDEYLEYVSEQMAEAFGYIVANFRPGSSGGMWARWGGDFEANRQRLDEFFRSVQPFTAEEEEMTPEEFKARWLAVYKEVEVAKTFDALKLVDANLSERIERHDHKTYPPNPPRSA